MIYLKDVEFENITSYMKKNFAVDLKKKRVLIEGRLSNHIANLGFDNYTDYFEYAKAQKDMSEITVLINKLTTNHTYFLRESEHFDFYREVVLPWVSRTIGTNDLRVWSAGCSSGQEPYTLTMINRDYLGSDINNWETTILASDISDKVLSTAKEGIYSKEELSKVPPSWIKKYFVEHGSDHLLVSDAVRKNVAYRNLNLISPFHFKKPFQAIFCRNVMIYFDMPTKNEIINKFYDVLLPGGYFFIGLSESLSSCDHKFKYVEPSVYQKGY